MGSSLVALSEELAGVVARAGEFVVAVHARPRFDSSGVHWKPGIVVTADHTIRRDEDIRITAANGRTYAAELAGRDAGTDLAVLRVKDLDVPAATPANNGTPRPGSVLLAVGRSKDSVSAAFGVLSSVSGAAQSWRGGRLDQIVRLDIALHPGASGAAVVDASGRWIGLATAALSRVSVLAIPLATVNRVAEKLLAHGRVPRGYLGVGLQPVAIPEHLKSKLKLTSGSGLIAISVDPDAPAGRAGMLIGDVLLELAGKPIRDPEDVQEALDADSIGKTIAARVLRGGTAEQFEITIGERPRRG